jgi:hypothetical protein
VYVAIEHKGFNPDMVCLLLPNVMRSEHPQVNHKSLSWFDYVPNFAPPEDALPSVRAFYPHHVATTNYLERFLDAFRNLLFLKYYLKGRDIPFFFGFWDDFSWIDPLTNEHTHVQALMDSDCPPELKNHYVKGVVDYDFPRRPGFISKFPQTIARDGGHFGPNSHYTYATTFVDAIKKRAEFKKLLEKWKVAE